MPKDQVEGPFGIFKEQFQIEKEVVTGMIKTKERINLDALVYNLIRLYNIKQEIENTTEDLEDFCESTSIKNQFKNLILADTLYFCYWCLYISILMALLQFLEPLRNLLL